MIILIALTLIQSACGIQITASGGGNGESGSVSMNFDALKDPAVNGEIAINGADLTPSTMIGGSIAKFEQTHSVKDTSGKSASVYVKVLNAPSGLTYASKVLPKEGSVATQTQVSAEQWLTVPKADSIKCTVTSSYGTARSASVGLEEARSTVAGDYVTLTGYYGKAVTTGSSVLASQTATSGAANSIKIYGTAKDSSGTYKVDTPIKGISGGKATFSGLSETASAGITTQVTQKEHLKGTFTGKATVAAKTITRSSNYGTEYDLNLAAKKSALGPTVSGIVGYYISPTLKIQGAVNAALSGDTINVDAGTYNENVKIDKSLTVKGAGSSKTIVDGNNAGSVFTVGKINPNAVVSLSGMTIKGGSGTAESRDGKTYLVGGGIYNKGKLTLTSCAISKNTVGSSTSDGYGGGIYNGGYYSGNTWIPAILNMISCTISGNAAHYSGGIDNDGKATIRSSKISGNIASSNTEVAGGISGGGITNWNIMNIMDSTISSNTAALNGGGIANMGTLNVQRSIISSNTAKQVGGGIWNSGAGTTTVSGSTISGNSATRLGGGIANGGALTITGSTISGNTAKYDGGGIANVGSLYIGGTSQIVNNQATTGYGGGIFSSRNTITFDGSKVAVKSNKAHLPSSQKSWYQGWGVYLATGTPILKNGFNPATQVTGNTHI